MAQRPPKNAMVDPKTGMPSREWLAWLQELSDVADPPTTTPPGTPPAVVTPPSGGGGGGGGSSDYGTGTPGKITKWVAVHTLGDSIISEAGGTVTIAGNLVAVTISGAFDPSAIDTGGLANAFLLSDATSTAGFHADVPFTIYPPIPDTYDLGRTGQTWRYLYLSGALIFAGAVLASPVAGAVEFLADDFFATITTGTARKAFVLDNGARLTPTLVPQATTNGRLIDGPANAVGVLTNDGAGVLTWTPAASASYEPLTNGDPVNPEIVFDSDGDVVMVVMV